MLLSLSSHRHPPHHHCHPHCHHCCLVVVIIVLPWHLPWASHHRCHRSWGGVVIVVNDAGRGVEWWVAVTSSLVIVLVVVIVPVPLVGQGGGGGVAATVVPLVLPIPLIIALSILIMSMQGRVVVGLPSLPSCLSASSSSCCCCCVDAGKGGQGHCHHACPCPCPCCRHVVKVVVTVVHGRGGDGCNELVFKSIGHYSSTPEHRTMCSMCSACSAVCFRFNQGTIDLCLLSVSPAHSLTSM